MSERIAGAASPSEVARETFDGSDSAGDAADQAGLGDLPYPLEDVESVLAMEDADDASDDPMHAGGLTPRPWVGAEVAAMHVVDLDNPGADVYLDDETDAERADPYVDQFDGTPEDLTPEDETLLGIDPYED